MRKTPRDGKTGSVGEPSSFDPLLGFFADWYWESDADLRFQHWPVRDDLPFDFDSELKGRSLIDIVSAPDAQKKAEELKKTLERHGRLENVEIEVGQNGRTAILCLSALPRYTEDGTFSGYRGTAAHVRCTSSTDIAQDRIRRANAAAGVGIYDFDPGRGSTIWSEELLEMLGLDRLKTELNFDAVVARIHPGDRQRARDLMHSALRKPQSYEFEYRVVTRTGRIRWLMDRGRSYGPLDPKTGLVRRASGTVLDVTDRKVAELSLKASEELFRSVFNQQFQFMVLLDADGTVIDVNELAMAASGICRDDVVGRKLWETVWFEDEPEEVQAWQRRLADAKSSQETGLAEVAYRTKAGERRHADSSITAIRDETGAVAFVVVEGSDITERKAQSENEEILLREISHRSKNILNVVQAIAMQTQGEDLTDYRIQLINRIGALGANLDLLVRNKWRSVELETLARTQLAHLEGMIGSRVLIEGPAVRLSAEAAQIFAMILHELATNAVKYGSLSTAGGTVKLSWTGSEHTDGGAFEASWTEAGGPEVKAPTRRGFGSTVVERMPAARLGSDVQLDFRPEGLCWSISCPLKAITERQDA